MKLRDREITAEQQARFWARVERRRENECWPWTGSRNPRGYGSVNLYKRGTNAHRLAFLFATGIAIDGLAVCHKCDNPPCCNPSHLFLGTQKDNMTDKIAKGRGNNVNGERVHGSKLNPAKVNEIRAKYQFRVYGFPRLAKEYGVGTKVIERIINGTGWKHVTAT